MPRCAHRAPGAGTLCSRKPPALGAEVAATAAGASHTPVPNVCPQSLVVTCVFWIFPSYFIAVHIAGLNLFFHRKS